ncbi:hypothetical protein EZJ43_08650 [Pedobacter changchengzhani]|uniref:Uncharacterized protein n=1 Tax=Pedobacter changchengzhani TaxID=2529274 RepID=A0A4V3A078_9SPHI|nr:hypothetical protein [Pedobacter changchengzhani]TDG36573.1 hypothetical protein EZJ43_08650 [Pedobacter changchengzhani]
MKKPEESKIIQISKKVAVCSTGIGTLILLAFLITKADLLMPFGLCYILIAIVINGVFALLLVIECLSNLIHWRKYIATIIFMLVNIPLSIFYCYIALNLKF